ncbi:MAG: hypothetical protein R2762_26955 [Bryobacteraceae bacterium]
MMGLLYRLAAMLRGHAFGDLGPEMSGVFEEAAQDTRRDGRWAYMRFCVREIGSVLAAPSRNKTRIPSAWRTVALYSAVGISAAAGYWLATGPRYSSTAALRFHNGGLSEHLVPSLNLAGSIATVDSTLRTVTSRTALTEAAALFQAYSENTLPADEIVARMRRDTAIRREGDLVWVTVSHPDKYVAQRVCRHFMMKLIDGVLNEQRDKTARSAGFLSSQLRIAGDELDMITKGLGAGPVSARRLLDANLAKRQYQSLSERLAEAKIAIGLLDRDQGPSVEVVDYPTLAKWPETRFSFAAACGLGAGLLVGLARYIWLAVQWQRSPMAEPLPL